MKNLFSNELSGGQLAVREHANSLSGNWGQSIKERMNTIKVLKQLCSGDSRIINDKLLSQNLSIKPYSRNFLDILRTYSVRRESRKPLLLPEPFEFIYSRDDLSFNKLYFGGVKGESTYSCIMGLSRGDALEKYGWNLNFYEKENILTIVGGGNHRTLAHLMYGNYNFLPQYHYIHKTDNLPVEVGVLHDSVKLIEEIGGEADVIFESGTKVESYVDFSQIISTDFKEAATQFLNSQDWRSYFRRSITFSEIVSMHDIYCEWSNQSKFSRIIKYAFKDKAVRHFTNFLNLRK